MGYVLLVKQVRSSSKLTPRQVATLKALGLRGLGSEVVRKDLRAIRGMLNKVQHIVRAERLEEKELSSRTKSAEKSATYRIEKS